MSPGDAAGDGEEIQEVGAEASPSDGGTIGPEAPEPGCSARFPGGCTVGFAASWPPTRASQTAPIPVPIPRYLRYGRIAPANVFSPPMARLAAICSASLDLLCPADIGVPPNDPSLPVTRTSPSELLLAPCKDVASSAGMAVADLETTSQPRQPSAFLASSSAGGTVEVGPPCAHIFYYQSFSAPILQSANRVPFPVRAPVTGAAQYMIWTDTPNPPARNIVIRTMARRALSKTHMPIKGSDAPHRPLPAAGGTRGSGLL